MLASFGKKCYNEKMKIKYFVQTMAENVLKNKTCRGHTGYVTVTVTPTH